MCPSLYAIDRDQKYMLAHNKFAYKKTKDDRKLEDRFQKYVQFSVAYSQNRRSKDGICITRADCIVNVKELYC